MRERYLLEYLMIEKYSQIERLAILHYYFENNANTSNEKLLIPDISNSTQKQLIDNIIVIGGELHFAVQYYSNSHCKTIDIAKNLYNKYIQYVLWTTAFIDAVRWDELDAITLFEVSQASRGNPIIQRAVLSAGKNVTSQLSSILTIEKRQ